MSMGSHAARLKDACSSLVIAWERAGEEWSDAQHERLGESHVLPLRTSLRAAESALDAMTEVLAAVKRDCT